MSADNFPASGLEYRAKELVEAINREKLYKTGECPTCRLFQRLVSPNYYCKRCSKITIENIFIGYN